MQRLRGIFAAVLSVTLATVPLMGAPTARYWGRWLRPNAPMWTKALRRLGQRCSAGRLSTAERMVSDSEGSAISEIAYRYSDIFNRQCARVHAVRLEAAIRAQSDAPTIGQVRLLNAKELLITSKRGPLSVTVDGETQIIEDGKAYHVYLDPEMAAAQGPSGAGGAQGPSGKGGSPLKAGRSRFLIVVVAVTAIATYFAVSEAMESAVRP